MIEANTSFKIGSTPELEDELGCNAVTAIPFNPIDFLENSDWDEYEGAPMVEQLQHTFDGLMRLDQAVAVDGDSRPVMSDLLQVVSTHFYNLGRQHAQGEKTD